MIDDNAKSLDELCEQSSGEQDRERLRDLTKKIERLLGESRKRLDRMNDQCGFVHDIVPR